MNLPVKSQQIIGPIVVIAICIGLFFVDADVHQKLRFDRTLIEENQFWRLLSANFIHTNLNHLLLNLAGVILLWGLHGHYYKMGSYLGLTLFCSAFCTLLLFYFAPDLSWYVGLSGTLHGLFILGAYYDIRNKLKSGWLLMLGIWSKVAYEQWHGPSTEVVAMIEANVAIDAHLFGAGAGLVAILYKLATTRETSINKSEPL